MKTLHQHHHQHRHHHTFIIVIIMSIIIIDWLRLLSSSQALQVVAKCCKPILAPSMYANVTDAIIPLPLLTKPVTCSVVSIVYSSPVLTSPTSELMMMQNYLQLKPRKRHGLKVPEQRRGHLPNDALGTSADGTTQGHQVRRQAKRRGLQVC